MNIFKTDDDQRLVWAWASIIEEGGEVVIDKQGDMILEDDLLAAAHDFMIESRTVKKMHRGPRVGRVVESMVMTKSLQQALGIELDRVGWLVCLKVEDDETWKAVKKGQLAALSVGGTAEREVIKYSPGQPRNKDGTFASGGGGGGGSGGGGGGKGGGPSKSITVDATDPASMIREAESAGLKATIVRQRGPSGYPEVSVSGPKKALTQALRNWGYDDEAMEIDRSDD